jgi:hypothetical protein
MKKLIIAVLAFVLAIGTMPVNPAAASVPFDPGVCGDGSC